MAPLQHKSRLRPNYWKFVALATLAVLVLDAALVWRRPCDCGEGTAMTIRAHADGMLPGGDGVTAGATRKQQPGGGAQAGAGLVPAGVGSVTVSGRGGSADVHTYTPAWAAACRSRPCRFAQMEDGEVDATVPFMSQFGEDTWLFHNLFYNKRNGFALEFGAMDGVTWSNTRWLAQAAGWKSMLIEACPTQYRQLEGNRSDAITVHAAICGDVRKVHWISAHSVGGIWEFMAPEFIQIFHRDKDPSTFPEIPCVPLLPLLDTYGVNEIDFWSLDVEGGELDVLQSIDFTKLSVGVLMVETDGHNRTKDDAVHSLLHGAGFDAVPKGPIFNDMQKMNTVFINRRYRHRLRHAPGIDKIQT